MALADGEAAELVGEIYDLLRELLDLRELEPVKATSLRAAAWLGHPRGGSGGVAANAGVLARPRAPMRERWRRAIRVRATQKEA